MSDASRGPARTGRELREALARPIFNKSLGKEVGAGRLDYEVYLRTDALFALQSEPAEVSIPEEMLFQIMHQTQELWLKAESAEVVSLVDLLADEKYYEAGALLDRIITIQRCLRDEIRILQTLTPDAYQVIRRNLGNGSGLESPGYNRLLLAVESVEALFDAALEKAQLSIVDLYARTTTSEAQRPLKRIAELLLDWDDAFQGWLFAHFMLVRRTIGVHRTVRALDGYPTQALAPRMTKPLFPRLWDARVEFTASWVRDGGHGVGAPRAPTSGADVTEIRSVAGRAEPK